MDSTYVCIGMVTQYIIANYETGHVQDLFPYDSEKTKPIVSRISQVRIKLLKLCPSKSVK